MLKHDLVGVCTIVGCSGFFKWIKNNLSILNAVNLGREHARGGLWNNFKISVGDNTYWPTRETTR